MINAVIEPMNKTISFEQREKTAQFVWTGFIVMFFVVQGIVWTIAITLTANDKSHAVVAGYDEKALRSDEEVALRAASKQLGWRTELLIDAAADVRDVHAITLKLADAKGQPLAGAAVQLTAFHRALAGDPQLLTLSEVRAGTYSGKIQFDNCMLYPCTTQARRFLNMSCEFH